MNETSSSNSSNVILYYGEKEILQKPCINITTCKIYLIQFTQKEGFTFKKNLLLSNENLNTNDPKFKIPNPYNRFKSMKISHPKFYYTSDFMNSKVIHVRNKKLIAYSNY